MTMTDPLMRPQLSLLSLFAVFAIVFVAVVMAETSKNDGKQQQLPHIVFIVLDDLGTKDCGFHGSGIYTPNIDSLVQQQAVFLNNYYTFCRCTQTRHAFMTGRYPYMSGKDNVIRMPIMNASHDQCL